MTYQRQIFPSLVKELDNRKIIILIGSRRVGKTTLLQMLREEEERRGKPTVFLDLDRELQLSKLESLEHFLDFLREEGIDMKRKMTVFIDEFQHAPKSVKIFKNISDHFPQIKIVASGSSSLDIKSLLPESLAGRKRVYHIYPLSFDELLHFQGLDVLREKMKRLRHLTRGSSELIDELKKKYEEYLLFGGYPEVVLKKSQREKIRELEDIYEAYIQKDIRSFFKMSNIAAYNQLVRILAFQSGGIFNVSNLSQDIGLDRRTVMNYIQILKDTFILTEIPSFHHVQKKKELIKAPKLYFFDTGIRNFSLSNFLRPLENRNDRGVLLETALISEAYKKKDIQEQFYYWRTKSGLEIDLVIVRAGRIIPVEIKYTKSLKADDFRALHHFLKRYPKTSGKILSLEKGKKKSRFKRDLWWDF